MNRESSLDDSGVVDDHDDGGDLGAELLQAYHMDKLRNDMTPVTLALSPKEVRIIKCNGNVARLKKHNVYELHPEYLSQIVVLGSYIHDHDHCYLCSSAMWPSLWADDNKFHELCCFSSSSSHPHR